jgi:cyanate lyase
MNIDTYYQRWCTARFVKNRDAALEYAKMFLEQLESLLEPEVVSLKRVPVTHNQVQAFMRKEAMTCAWELVEIQVKGMNLVGVVHRHCTEGLQEHLDACGGS